MTGLLPVQAPAWQASVWVHALPSLHVVPSGRLGLEQTPDDGSHVPAAWHWSEAVQMTGLLPVHTPVSQASVCVQALLSLQVVPSGKLGLEQTPVDVLHVPTPWHWSDAVQMTGLLPVQTPPTQVSVCVQGLLSLQVVPSGRLGLEQTPVDVLQVPTLWHWSSAVQMTGLLPVQTPPTHVSVCVHALLSLQEVPSDSLDQVVVEVAGVQSWHAFVGSTVPEAYDVPAMQQVATALLTPLYTYAVPAETAAPTL